MLKTLRPHSPLRTDQLERVQFIERVTFGTISVPGHHLTSGTGRTGAKSDALKRVGTKGAYSLCRESMTKMVTHDIIGLENRREVEAQA
ncbi:MAG TPA: hypothetical protein VFU49_15030 [Ktedonobacteraceae bacterium]|nr:hypothetical protein [Ktedonobacteraceae bacterium]